MGEMKGTMGGKDEISMGVLRAAGKRTMRLVASQVAEMWEKPVEEWEPEVNVVLGVLLFKKGARNKFDNYRTIMLICLVSRILARVAARRVKDFSERERACCRIAVGLSALQEHGGTHHDVEGPDRHGLCSVRGP